MSTPLLMLVVFVDLVILIGGVIVLSFLAEALVRRRERTHGHQPKRKEEGHYA
jgi:hypothetical protein